MRPNQFLFWAVLTCVAAATAGVVFRSVDPWPSVQSATPPTAAKPGVLDLPSATVVALNRCFDVKPPEQCKAEASAVLQSVALARDDEMGVVARGAEFNVAYFLRSDIAAETSVLFWTPNCAPGALASDVFALNVFPRIRQDLTPKQRKSGFAVYGFSPKKRAVRAGPSDRGCVASQRLPNIPLKRMIAGQYNRAGPNKGFVWMQKMALTR